MIAFYQVVAAVLPNYEIVHVHRPTLRAQFRVLYLATLYCMWVLCHLLIPNYQLVFPTKPLFYSGLIYLGQPYVLSTLAVQINQREFVLVIEHFGHKKSRVYQRAIPVHVW